jgi:hypothetical protein
MTASSSPHESVEHFAQLCAALDAGFASRADVLEAAALDEDGWRRLCNEWLPRLATTDAPDLAVSFTRAYGRARRPFSPPETEHVRSGAAPVDAEAGPREADPEDTLIDEVPAALAHPDATVAGAFPLAGPALPFTRGGLGLPLPVVAGKPVQRPHLPGPAAPAESTLEVPCAPLPAAAALPFVRAPGSSSSGRLMRFDPHTGKPLPVPRWIDGSPRSRSGD